MPTRWVSVWAHAAVGQTMLLANFFFLFLFLHANMFAAAACGRSLRGVATPNPDLNQKLWWQKRRQCVVCFKEISHFWEKFLMPHPGCCPIFASVAFPSNLRQVKTGLRCMRLQRLHMLPLWSWCCSFSPCHFPHSTNFEYALNAKLHRGS